jgi:hypothetical protein
MTLGAAKVRENDAPEPLYLRHFRLNRKLKHEKQKSRKGPD